MLRWVERWLRGVLRELLSAWGCTEMAAQSAIVVFLCQVFVVMLATLVEVVCAKEGDEEMK